MANNTMTSAKNAMLIKKWNKRILATESVHGKLNTEKKVALAVTLENTSNRLRLAENTQPASIG